MAQVSTNEFKAGIKVEVEGQPYVIVTNEFVKPGKGQSFNRVRIKHLLTGRTIEKTFKSGEKLDIADVAEVKMRMLYKEQEGIVFMDEKSYEQHTLPMNCIGDNINWMMDDLEYDVLFYKGVPVSVEAPTFMDMRITETAPGDRGNTASGRVLKSAVVESGAKVQVPIFVEEGELIKVDTRTGEYVSRVN